MAKDPAFLFYPGDWLGGTMGMTFEEKGAYLELLLFQFNNGKFTKAQAKQVLSICSASVFEKVLQKFNTEGNLYWKQKLSDEIERRKNFAESRRNNAKGNKSSKKGVKAYAKHMETETLTETEIENLNEYERWTESILDNNDPVFEPMAMNECPRLTPELFTHLVRDHLGLLNRYPKMRPQNQQAFRRSLIKHINENWNKNGSNGKQFTKESHAERAARAFAERHGSKPE